jgi:hypothetical protein
VRLPEASLGRFCGVATQQIGIAWAWAYDFICKNYEGDADELGEILMFMADIGLGTLEGEEITMH